MPRMKAWHKDPKHRPSTGEIIKQLMLIMKMLEWKERNGDSAAQDLSAAHSIMHSTIHSIADSASYGAMDHLASAALSMPQQVCRNMRACDAMRVAGGEQGDGFHGHLGPPCFACMHLTLLDNAECAQEGHRFFMLAERLPFRHA